jgi:hypothetical protein
VALTVLDDDGWGRHVSLVGRIVTLEDDVDLRDIDRLARRYTGRAVPNAGAPPFQCLGPPRALARLERLTPMATRLLAVAFLRQRSPSGGLRSQGRKRLHERR